MASFYRNQLSQFYMDTTDLKRKLRELKRLECKLRYGVNEPPQPAKVWDRFFDLHEPSTGKAKYTLAKLAVLNHEEYKQVIRTYWAYVYHTLFSESDFPEKIPFDSSLLLQLNLPFDADETAVKKRFRELAKLYHPDTGGDAGKFIELMEVYRSLTGK